MPTEPGATSLPARGRVPTSAADFDSWLVARRRRRRIPFPRWPLFLIALGGVVYLGAGYDYRPLTIPPVTGAEVQALPEDQLSSRIRALESETQKLSRIVAAHTPRGRYIVVDRVNNRIFLRNGDEVELSALCSSGSGRFLKAETRERTWTFETPPGRFKVLRKIEDPVWKKPDWAFLEEGKEVPRNSSERFEYGVLGEYALYFGDGYMIHGTLYERLLGRSVSHGCIRVGREDLRQIYRAASVGTPIYIF
ncbi:MAG: L,D-transpeptidase [Candidatus Eisenbacteria bacterium]